MIFPILFIHVHWHGSSVVFLAGRERTHENNANNLIQLIKEVNYCKRGTIKPINKVDELVFCSESVFWTDWKSKFFGRQTWIAKIKISFQCWHLHDTKLSDLGFVNRLWCYRNLWFAILWPISKRWKVGDGSGRGKRRKKTFCGWITGRGAWAKFKWKLIGIQGAPLFL